MAKKFLITYDLRKPGKNYMELYDAIKGLGEWIHPLESVWAVRVDDNVVASSLYRPLRAKIDDGDYLFIVEITDVDYYGWIAKGFVEWLKE